MSELTKGTLSQSVILDMHKRYNAFVKLNKRLPSKIATVKGGKDYLKLLVFDSVIARFDIYTRQHQGTMPPNIDIINITPTPKPVRIVGPIQRVVESHLGQFNNISGFANKMRGRGYGAYSNDRKSLEQEDTLLANLNCTDATQLLIHLAAEMKGYTFRYVHVSCKKSGEGHIYGEGKGRELGTNWFRIDLAAMMSKSTMATLGHGWCFDVTPTSYNDPWLTQPDDGKMT